MPNSRAMKLYALSILLPLAQGVDFAVPSSAVSPPSETPAPILPAEDNNALDRRQASTITTQTQPPWVCGWEAGALNFPVHCDTTERCVFHTSDSIPAAYGCCPLDGSNCIFHSGPCYASEQVAATPSLSSLPRSHLCTDPMHPYCLTQTYPELSLGGPIVGAICVAWTVTVPMLTTATSTSYSAGTTVTVIHAMSAPSFVDDSYILAHRTTPTWYPNTTTSSSSTPPPPPAAGSLSTGSPSSTSTSTSTSTTSASTSSPTSSSSSSNGSGSSSTSTIVGSVVGSVLGGAGIIAASIIFALRRRRNQEKKDGPEDGPTQEPRESGGSSANNDGDVEPKPSQLDGSSVSNGTRIEQTPRELDGSSASNGTYVEQRPRELDGSTVSNGTGAGVEGDRVPGGQVVEGKFGNRPRELENNPLAELG